MSLNNARLVSLKDKLNEEAKQHTRAVLKRIKETKKENEKVVNENKKTNE